MNQLVDSKLSNSIYCKLTVKLARNFLTYSDSEFGKVLLLHIFSAKFDIVMMLFMIR